MKHKDGVYTITNRFTENEIWSGKADSEKDALFMAIRAEANLSRADLSWANLSEANLSEANLSWADLSWANLRWANLSRANLSEANLRWANLSRANLSGANLLNVRNLIPPLVLLASWNVVSDDLCLDLMRYDASNHPHPEKFLKWADDGPCPYDETNILRSAHFREKKELIKSDFLDLQPKSALELMNRLIEEKCKK